ncbi:MAG: hypothetical protein AUG91_04760 [Actinobacteria bacterium 13_1_20CM_4_69_9]|nr:MAG: hypothetical protein AUG91_04760 [Actinobacteria bacterium 13_1_20CM_4_69_9]
MPTRPAGSDGSVCQRFFAGVYETTVLEPPAITIAVPAQTAVAFASIAGGAAMRRHALRAGLYAAACRPPTTTYSFPVQTPSGCWFPRSGAAGSARHAFVRGL